MTRSPPLRQPGAVSQAGSGSVGGEAPGDHNSGGGQAGCTMIGGAGARTACGESLCASLSSGSREVLPNSPSGGTGSLCGLLPGAAVRGCRKTEIMTLRWDHVDRAEAEIRIVNGRGDRA